ncbi:MAG TPA: alpha/beta fold hydrolase [Desulfurivibrionaceae bacterium]|nr:alpha/beta fold hydrolase [Desulfurivibrionaceae bacterium]
MTQDRPLQIYRPPGPLPLRPVLFIPGWGFDGRVLELAPELRWLAPLGVVAPATFADQLHRWLVQEKVDAVDLVGWSLGGYCALDFARRFPEQVASLTLHAVRQRWPLAETEGLVAELAAAPEAFLSSFYRKCFLGYKAAYQRFAAELESYYLARAEPAVLQEGLRYLANFAVPARIACETLCCHGRRDVIAPLAERLTLMGAHQVTLDHGGHPLFLEEGMARPESQRKRGIRQRFSKAAATYDQHADVQAELAATLVEGLAADAAPGAILELGCGTGTYTLLLARKFPDARVTALDFAPAMLAQARQKVGGHDQVDFLCADAEAFLGAGQGRYDCITANATLQWFEELERACQGIRSMLAPGGFFWGSIFGRETLHELEEGLRQVFGGALHAPASRFLTAAELTAIANRVFDQVEIRELRLTRQYATLADLLYHFKKTGTGGSHAGGLFLGRRRLAELEAWFREHYGGFRLTFQIFLVRCR